MVSRITIPADKLPSTTVTIVTDHVALRAHLQRAEYFLFDCDGLLLDTESLYSEAALSLLRELAQEQQAGALQSVRFPASLKLKIMGQSSRMTATAVATWMRNECAVHVSDEECMRRLHVHETRLFARGCELLPGATQLIHQLTRRGRKLAVATSSRRSVFSVKMASHADLFVAFHVIVCGDELRETGDAVDAVFGKPHPRIFHVARQRLLAEERPRRARRARRERRETAETAEAEAEETAATSTAATFTAATFTATTTEGIVFEDSPNGVVAALRSGHSVVWIPTAEVASVATVDDLEAVMRECAHHMAADGPIVYRCNSLLDICNLLDEMSV